MQMTIELTAEEASRLLTRAASAGMSPEQYLREVLVGHHRSQDSRVGRKARAEAKPSKTPALPKSPAGLVRYWHETDAFVAFTDGPDSIELARALRKRMGTREL